MRSPLPIFCREPSVPSIDTDPLVLALGPWLATEVPRPLGAPGMELGLTAATLVGEVATLLSISRSRPFSPQDQQRLLKELPALWRVFQQRMHEVVVELGPAGPPQPRGRRRTGVSARHAVVRGSLRRLLDTIPQQMEDALAALRRAVALGPQEQRLLRPLVNSFSEVFLLGSSPPPITQASPLPATLLTRWLPDLDHETRTAIVTGLLARSTPTDVLALETLLAQVTPDTLAHAGLWPLSPERIRPWLLHPAREMREAGMRMLDHLQPQGLPLPEPIAPPLSLPPVPPTPRRRTARQP